MSQVNSQTSVVAAEIWLRDDLEKFYAVLFGFVGNGFQLALCNVGWLTARKFVILVPDPIVFAPRSVLLDCTASFATVILHQDAPLRLRIARAMAFPRINCNTTTCYYTGGPVQQPHFRLVFVFFVSTLITWRPRRVPSIMSASPSSSARASLVTAVKTRLTKPPSHDTQWGQARVTCTSNLSQA